MPLSSDAAGGAGAGDVGASIASAGAEGNASAAGGGAVVR
jgi:hypothetical protein